MDTRHAERRLTARWTKQACGESNGERLSLMQPQFNLREVAKQMLLLEDHLQHPYKHCPDCIRKHLMTIEAFSEEAVALDTVGVYRKLGGGIAELARLWLENFEDGESLSAIAQEVRTFRKELVSMVCDPRDAVARVASRFLATSTPCAHQRVDLHG